MSTDPGRSTAPGMSTITALSDLQNGNGGSAEWQAAVALFSLSGVVLAAYSVNDRYRRVAPGDALSHKSRVSIPLRSGRPPGCRPGS